MLRPGTHHVRFLVDGQWRVADDLPAAVDDQGSLANYVAVPIPTPAPAPAPRPVTRDRLIPGQSFWSADSSADGESEHHHHQPQQQQQTSPTLPHTTHSQSTNWTNILPPELIEAAREEEAYLSASAGQYEGSSSSNTRVTTGFVPAPNIPPAPGLPRHLEKLILNTRVGAGAPGAVASGSSSGGGGGGTGVRSRSGQAMGGVGSMGVGSGQAQAARKERRDRERDGDRERRDGDKRDRDRDRDRERDRDRDRDRERGERGMRKRATTAAASAAVNIPPPPPPPPPSEDGGAASWVPPSALIPGATSSTETGSVGATAVESIDSSLITASSTTTPSSMSTPASRLPTISTNTSATTPQSSLPITSIAAMSPVQGVWPKDKAHGGASENGNGTGTETSPTISPKRSPTTLHTIPNMSASTSAATSANTSATASPNLNAPTSTAPIPSTPNSFSACLVPSSISTLTYPHTTPSGSRTITIDSTNMPSLSDDGSVLPVPSHVVLHHLSTSAIRNGVLAVGNTNRYRKKVSFILFFRLFLW